MDAPKKARPPIIGLHIPKSAGMALLQHVRAHLPGDKFLELTGALFTYYHNRFITWYDVQDPKKLRLIFGHHVHEEQIKYFENTSFMFTVLRDPIDRIESDFFYNQKLAKVELSFEDFLRGRNNNLCSFLRTRFPTIAKAYGGDIAGAAICILNMFDRVYLYDNFADLIPEICQRLSIPSQLPVANQREPGLKLTAAQRKEIAQRCARDLEVYSAIRSSRGPSGKRLRQGAHEILVAERSQLLGTSFSEKALMEFMSRYTVGEFRTRGKLDEYRAYRERQRSAMADELRQME